MNLVWMFFKRGFGLWRGISPLNSIFLIPLNWRNLEGYRDVYGFMGWIELGLCSRCTRQGVAYCALYDCHYNRESQKMEWKWMKRIIFKIFFSSLVWSFNGGNGKSILLFGILRKREWNKQKGTHIPLYSLKISIFHYSWNCEE